MRAALTAIALATLVGTSWAREDAATDPPRTTRAGGRPAATAPTAAGPATPAAPAAPAAPATDATAATDDASLTHEPPLIAYALELNDSDSKEQFTATADLSAINFEMSRHPPPPDSDCAQTLGAARFADQYAQLASIQFALGNFEASIKADESALACTPRDASLYASIASGYLSLGRINDARMAVERGNAVNPDDSGVRDVRARVDFIQERWADAVARFRLSTLPDENPDLVDYHECFFWLAQRRAGVQHPELPLPRKEESAKPRHWPMQILDVLKGDLTEAELVEVIRDEARGDQAREWLTEALYYVGELRLAEGDAETARKHFASVVNLRVLNFVEFGMARAELARMRERGTGADKAPAAGTDHRPE